MCEGKFVPVAIPEPSTVPVRFFELDEDVSVFDELLMRKVCSHFVKTPLDGQLTLFEID